MTSYLDVDFDTLYSEAIEDTARTAAEIRAEIMMPGEEEEVAQILADTADAAEKEKSDLPEKSRFQCPMACQCSRRSEDDEVDALSLDELTKRLLKPNADDVSDGFVRLVENSEHVFHGFEDLLVGSAGLLGDLGKLIRSSRTCLADSDSQERETTDSTDANATEESLYDLSPHISLTALERASDLEKERIKQLQEQIKAMNDSIRETDLFIKDCQKINDALDEECKKIDTCMQQRMTQNHAFEDHAEMPESRHSEVVHSQTSQTMGDYQTANACAPNFDRWSMLYHEPHDSEMGAARLPFTAPGLSMGEGEPHHQHYFIGPPYEELESIWESGEEEESAD